jgi:hypothetical protein
LTRVKQLEKIVPEQIQTATPDQVLTGEAHDFAYFFTMPWLEAVDLTVLASRLLLQGAPQPAVKCIQQECAAFITNRKFAKRQPLEVRQIGQYDRSAALVVGLAVNRGKLQEDLEVLDFLLGKWLQ